MLRNFLCVAACTEVARGFRVSKEPTVGGAHYYWPTSRGDVDATGVSPYVGPKLEHGDSSGTTNNSDLLWVWHHPKGPFGTTPIGVAVDEAMNSYLSTDLSMWKISPNGTAVWEWVVPHHDSWIVSGPSIADGKVFFSTENGKVWAVDMMTGGMKWVFKIAHKMNQTDRGLVSVRDGIVVAAFNATWEGTRRGNGFVAGFRALDGHPIWAVKPDAPTTSFHACFPGDGTVVYQDAEGSAYSHDLQTGIARWKVGGVPDTWTTGSPVVAKGVLYTVVSNASDVEWEEDSPDALVAGFLMARNASTGQYIWGVSLPLPPNGAPVVGRLPGRSGLSVVQPCGTNVQNGSTAVYAFDAAMGTKQWSFRGPDMTGPFQAGALMGMGERLLSSGSIGIPVTPPWSAPVIDAEGTVFLGNQDGLVYRLRDENMDGIVEGDGEVGTFDSGAAFFSASSPVILPGMMVFANTNSLFALRTNKTPVM